MNVKIKIENLETFLETIKAVQKVIDRCKFEISPEGTKINSTTLDGVSRMFFKTNSMTSESDCSFCFNNLALLYKPLSILLKMKMENVIINYNGKALTYSNGIKFRLTTIKEELVESYLTPDIKTKLEYEFEVDCSKEKMAMINSNFSSFMEETSKVYFYKENDKLMVELSDRKNEFSNALSFPIGPIPNVNLSSSICLPVQTFKNFSIVPADEILIKYATINLFHIQSTWKLTKTIIEECEGDKTVKVSEKKMRKRNVDSGYFLDYQMICSPIKH